jgi:hypothetical protein
MDKETFKKELEKLLQQFGFTFAQTDDDKLSLVRSTEYVNDELEMTVIFYESSPDGSE